MRQFLTKQHVSELTALSKSTIDRMETDGDFPKRRTYKRPNREGTPYWSRVYWPDEHVYNWMAAQVERGQAPETELVSD